MPGFAYEIEERAVRKSSFLSIALIALATFVFIAQIFSLWAASRSEPEQQPAIAITANRSEFLVGEDAGITVNGIEVCDRISLEITGPGINISSSSNCSVVYHITSPGLYEIKVAAGDESQTSYFFARAE
jgi:hypothetical protein